MFAAMAMRLLFGKFSQLIDSQQIFTSFFFSLVGAPEHEQGA